MYPAQKELLLGGRGEFLDSAVCHTRVGFGYQQVGGDMARPLLLSSAEALLFSMEGRCIRLSTLISALFCHLCLVCECSAAICSTEVRCRGNILDKSHCFLLPSQLHCYCLRCPFYQEQWLNLYFAVALDRVADMVLCEDGSKGVPCPNKSSGADHS